MSETYPSESTMISDLNGIDVEIPAENTDPHYEDFCVKVPYRLGLLAEPSGSFRVKDAGDIDIDIEGGDYCKSDGTIATYAGETGTTLTNNTTNYVFLEDGDSTATVNTTGFPSQSTTPHLPLATVVTSGGDITSITQNRDGAMFATPHMPEPMIDFDIGSEAANVIAVTIQMQDLGGHDLSERYLVHCWLGDSAYDDETAAAPSGGVSVSTGTALETITANKRWSIITDSSGTIVLDITEAADKSFYLMAEVNGRIYASGEIDFD